MQLSFQALEFLKTHKTIATENWRASKSGIKLIEGFEGCRLAAYLDTAGVPTIGWGSTRYANGKKVKMGDRLNSVEEADALFLLTLKSREADVDRMITAPLNQNQFDALVSWHYNTGGVTANICTLRAKLNSGDYRGAADQFLVWNKVTKNGKKVVSEGLTKRREQERRLFLTPITTAN